MNRAFQNLLVASAFTLPLTGCMTKSLQPVKEDGTYCSRVGKSHHPTLTCTTQPVPTAAADLEAKRFVPDPNALTVYVVRQRWGDPVNRVPITLNDGTTVLTVPESIVRIRLPAGSHKVTLTWEGKTATHAVEGKAGEVLFVQVVGSVWSWGSSYAWDAGDADDARARALKSRLIADITMQ